MLRLTRIESDADDASGSCPLFVAGYDAWDGLSLDYRVPWPVHLLLTKPVRLLLHPLLTVYMIAFHSYFHICTHRLLLQLGG